MACQRHSRVLHMHQDLEGSCSTVERVVSEYKKGLVVGANELGVSAGNVVDHVGWFGQEQIAKPFAQPIFVSRSVLSWNRIS